MSAPLIWIILPAAAALIFWTMRKRTSLVILLATVLCLFLALLAWVLPVGELIRVGPLSFRVGADLAFLGRRFVLADNDMPFLIFVNVLCAFWFAGSQAAGANRLLVPFGLGIVTLLTAALAVEPFLYAALLIEMAVLLAVPILVPAGTQLGQGVLRFIIFQTLALPFILLAGWALQGVEANPSNQTLVLIATVLVGLGFAFWLGIFPFNTWIPQLAEQVFPYVSGFLFFLLSSIQLLLGLAFLDQFGWLRTLPALPGVIGLLGVLMIVTAGIWAAFQKNLARLLGYSVIVETGFSLMAIGLRSQVGLDLFASMFLPRLIGLGLWSLCLSILLQEAKSSDFDRLGGLARKMPFASAGLGVASLSLGGLPLLAVFPIREVLLQEAARQSLLSAQWALAGMMGILFSSFRALLALTRRTGEGEGTDRQPVSAPVGQSVVIPAAPVSNPALPQTGPLKLPQTGPLKPPVEANSAAPRYLETPTQIMLILGGIVLLILIGVFPQAFFPLMNGLVNGFTNLP